LLDDVNLAGANGILVNITAGPDFTMSEFDEVGRTVENFASEDATIVIGTVLDPDMADDVRVTVVATGLNRAAVRNNGRGGDQGQFDASVRRPHVQLINTGKRDGTTGMFVEDPVEAFSPGAGIAANLRGQAASEPAAPQVADFGDSNYLDIPAFLRRQAD